MAILFVVKWVNKICYSTRLSICKCHLCFLCKQDYYNLQLYTIFAVSKPSVAWSWAVLMLNTRQMLFSLSMLANTVCFTLYLYQHNKSSVYVTCYLQLWFVGIVGWFWLAQKSLISHQKHDTVSIWGKSQTCF